MKMDCFAALAMTVLSRHCEERSDVAIHFILRLIRIFNKIHSMTKDDFLFLVETETIHDFLYKGKTYTITYDKSPDGRKWIVFGDIADKQKYDSVGEFLNKAKIENHFFKDMLDIF